MVTKPKFEKNPLVSRDQKEGGGKEDEEEAQEKCLEKERHQTKLQHSQPQQQLPQQQRQQQQTQRPAFSIDKMTQMARVSIATITIAFDFLL